MPGQHEFILGESARTLDERHRLSIPPEMASALTAAGPECVLVKERLGCLSLWNAALWRGRFDPAIDLVQAKVRARKLEGRLEDLQLLGRLLSTRQRIVQLAGRGRLLIPEGFRDFLGVEGGGEALIVGAAVCVEIWKPAVWIAYLEAQAPNFQRLLDGLSG